MDKILNCLTEYYVRKNIIPEEKKEVYFYGLKLITSDIINFSIIMILGLILGRFLDSVVFLLSFCTLRLFSGGFHAKTFWLCRLTMMLTFSGVVLLSMRPVPWQYAAAANAAAVIVIALLAPIEHPNKPLKEKQKKRNKIKAIIMSVFLAIVSATLAYIGIKTGITISLTLLSVVVLMIVGMAVTKGGEQ